MSFEFVAPIVHTFELHLWSDSAFTSGSWGRKVKDLGGKYSECRGYEDTRFVFLPNTAPGRKLAAELLTKFDHGKHTTVIFRNVEGACTLRGNGEATLIVQGVDSKGDTLAQLGALLIRFEEESRAWWEREGRAAAVAKAEREASWVAEQKAAAPGAAAEAVRRALALGCSRDEVMAAVQEVFGGAS